MLTLVPGATVRTTVVPGEVGGPTEPRGCLVSVVSTKAGLMVVVCAEDDTRAVGTVVSGTVVEATDTGRALFGNA